MATFNLSRGRNEELKTCQRRLEYLSSRLQDLAIEIGDGQGAVWLKQNMWFLNKPAMYFDDVLFSVGKICNHLVSYLTFHKQKLASNFPFLSYMGILYEVGEILGIVRDMLLVNPSESLSVKQSQIDLFWTDCTPFLFIFENSNHLLLSTRQIPLYMRAMLDLVPAVIQVGMCMYCSVESQLRGFDCFAESCIRLSKALVEPGEFLAMAEQLEPVIVPFLRQWILFALELVQNGVKVRTDQTFLSPRVSARLDEAKREFNNINNEDKDQTVPKTLNVLSLSSNSSLPDEIADSSLAPLKIKNSCLVRASCQPYKWIDVANTRLAYCPNEQRKGYLEEISLRENQKLISDIFIMYGKKPVSWKGIRIHCPLTKRYDEIKVKLFIKVKVGEKWEEREGQYDRSFSKGDFLVFNGCTLEGFVAIEERPMTSKKVGPEGGKLTTPYDPNMEANIPAGRMSKSSLVKMMVQPTDTPAERQYRDACPDDFKHIKATSQAIEIEGVSMEEKNISIKIPFTVLSDPNTKILVLKYTRDNIEVNDSEGLLQETDENVFTVNSGNGGTVLATVDHRTYSSGTEANVRREMEVLLGKKQLCKLLIFVENQNATHEAQVDVNQIVLSVVCAEKYRLSEVIKDKTKIGLIELPKSQSPDRLLKQADDIKLEIKGSVSLDPDIPDDAYTLTYLEGSDNYVRFPVNIADCNGRITFVLRLGRDNSVLHTYFCNVADILALIVSEKSKEDPQPEKETEVIKDKISKKETVLRSQTIQFEDSNKHGFTPSLMRETSSCSVSQDESESTEPDNEASLKILNRNSLVNLAKYIISDEGSLLGVCLGLKPEKISQIYRMYRHSSSLASFYVLYEWRGRKTQPDLADKLIQALFDIGRRDLASIVSDVRKQKRGLSSEDFAHLNIRHKSRRS
ncbi:uncharacterized protein LOC132715849 isoform X4 [Ruditapes philippinarum]|uniref:uncharacterized protein LOC132715849 isoform X4 n=1 Tax=Ruditapes philippinarum TaxID=129788 RepID=UPI00295B7D36|nr:uncharacterized protein LOC132715849 isoform X4 [Ruditapes philippinarum]